MEKLGTENLTKVVKAVCQCANVVSKLLHKQGLLALLGLQEPVAVIASTPWVQVFAEVKDLDTEERLALEKVASDEFKPLNPVADAGLDKLLALGEKTAALVEKDVQAGKDAFESAKGLVEEWKSFLGAA